MASLFTNIVPRWFYKQTRFYLKGANRIAESVARKVRCRGDVRAAQRRLDREAKSRWRQANERALPFRMKIIARIIEEQKRIAAQVFGQKRAQRGG